MLSSQRGFIRKNYHVLKHSMKKLNFLYAPLALVSSWITMQRASEACHTEGVRHIGCSSHACTSPLPSPPWRRWGARSHSSSWPPSSPAFFLPFRSKQLVAVTLLTAALYPGHTLVYKSERYVYLSPFI